MPDLLIRIKRNTDRTAALTCTRADGSVTWQKQLGGHALFFPRHDLTHYAVETVLGHRRGFYGLLAEGWDFSDFGEKWGERLFPADAEPAELIVGFFDAERYTEMVWSAAEMIEQAAVFYAANKLTGAPPLEVTDDQLARIRQRMGELFARWDVVAPGEALELPFDIPARRVLV